MTHDPTEAARRAMIENDIPARDLQRWKGKHIDTETLRRDYEVLGFLAPFVCVRRKSDGKKGTLEFTHAPRVYFNWLEDGS
jgi:hypothetical protein